MIRTLATITFATALITVPFATVTSAPRDAAADVSELKAAKATKITKSVRRPVATLPDDGGRDARYIVQFEGDAVPLALAKRSTKSRSSRAAASSGPVDTKSPAAYSMVNAMRSQQREVLARMSAEAGPVQVLRTHQHALNAATVRMSVATARRVQRMPGVKSVQRDQAVELTTATSVPFIGADQVWDGSATGGIGYLGEGTVVGIIDSGINHEHPSFAATGADGYTVTNPLGEGVYLGECATIPGLCNSKLIGAYTFLDSQDSDPPDEILIPGDAPSSDTDGHGSHVASTAAGNFVYDVALPDADGVPGSVVFDQISGVAPHANVVAYKVCAPSCFFADIVAAVDQAIADGIVDVLNHSIGSPSGSPWASSQATAFLNARAAGIFVANSAGNSGPGAGTAEAGGNAPWVAAVAATTHDRSYPLKFLQDMNGGGPAPADISGRSVSGGITGDIVYAGDFPTSNGSANDTEPEQCLDPFPPGTFTSDQIVMCDRGSIARVAKGQHVRDGGAGGFILGNVEGGATSINNDVHVIPSIHINAEDAALMREWLANGSGQRGTITAVDTPITDPAAGDNIAGFSSRGPYTGYDILAPNTGAPGVEIFAAGAELTQEQVDLIAELYAGTPSETPAVRGAYGAIGGTSMASPHIAGTAALLKQAHPDWTDAEILSAIMTTGSWDLVKEDGVTPADPFDFGGGRVQVALAVQAGLVLDESSTNFELADPALGGEPSTLNVAGLVEEECVLICSWTRTVEATTAGSWSVETSDPSITVSPASFSLAAGETQTLEITASSAGLPADEWAFGRVDLVPGDSLPTQHLTLAFVPSSGEVPSEITVVAGRDADSYLVSGIESVEITDLQVTVGGLVAPSLTEMSLEEDSANGSPYDDLSDGVDFILVPTTGGDVRLVAFTEDATSESPDLDLFVGFDSNGNGLPEESEEICVSATATATERCDVSGTAESGNFWVLVQNWNASDTPPDALVLSTALVEGDEGNLTVDAPTAVPELTPFDIRLIWDLPEAEEGDVFYGTVALGTDASNPDNIGVIPVTITRGADDVLFSVSSDSAVPGDTLTFSIEVAANLTPEDRNYDIAAEVPEGFTLIPESVTGGGSVDGGLISWTVSQASLLGLTPSYEVTTSMEDAACAVPFANSGGYADLEAFGIFPDLSIEGDETVWSAFASQNFNFYGESFVGGFNFMDNGFAFFGDPTATSPVAFINQPIPSVDDPNSLMAILWRDFIVPTPSATPGAVVGVSLATAGSNLSLLEYDNVKLWPGDGDDSIDIQLAVRGFADDSPGAYEIFMAFDNIEGDFSFGTIGVEDAAGTTGTQYAFDDVAVTDGMAICYDLVGPAIEPAVLTYQVTVDEEAVDTIVTSVMTNSVDSVGSETVEETLDVEVTAPARPGDINGDGVVDRSDVDLILAARNTPADGPDDPRDMNGDGIINMLDARLVILECDEPNCRPAVP